MTIPTEPHHRGRRPLSAFRTVPRAGALFTCLLLAGCRTGGGWAPAEPDAFERLPAESTGRWGSTTELRVGGYTADSVKVSWARGSGAGVQVGGLGTDHSRSQQEYRFSLRSAGGARVPVLCHSSARERNVGLRSIEMRTSASYTYDCDVRPGSGAAWQLALVDDGDAGFTGALTSEDARFTVHTELAGNRVTGRRASRYEVRDGAAVIAIVDPLDRVVWLSRGAVPDDRRQAAVAAAVALLLYQRPIQ